MQALYFSSTSQRPVDARSLSNTAFKSTEVCSQQGCHASNNKNWLQAWENLDFNTRNIVSELGEIAQGVSESGVERQPGGVINCCNAFCEYLKALQQCKTNKSSWFASQSKSIFDLKELISDPENISSSNEMRMQRQMQTRKNEPELQEFQGAAGNYRRCRVYYISTRQLRMEIR